MKVSILIPVGEETLYVLSHYPPAYTILMSFLSLICSYISKHKHMFPPGCCILASDLSTLEILHDKFQFSQLTTECGNVRPTPTIKVTSVYHVTSFLHSRSDPKEKFILKPVHSRGGMMQVICSKSDNNPPPEHIFNASSSNPWVLQKYVNGTALSSFAVAHKGEVLGFVSYKGVCSSDMTNGFSVIRQTVRNAHLLKWTRNIVEEMVYTGQIGFDFIESDEGYIYPLECNPRATNGVAFYAVQRNIFNPLYVAAASCSTLGFTPNQVK